MKRKQKVTFLIQNRNWLIVCGVLIGIFALIKLWNFVLLPKYKTSKTMSGNYPSTIVNAKVYYNCIDENVATETADQRAKSGIPGATRSKPFTCTRNGKTYYVFPSAFSDIQIEGFEKLPEDAKSIVRTLGEKNFDACMAKDSTEAPRLTVYAVRPTTIDVIVSCGQDYHNHFEFVAGTWTDKGKAS